MSPEVKFRLRRLDGPLKLDATLAERSNGIPAIMKSRAVTPHEEIMIEADFDNDGRLDALRLTIAGGSETELGCTTSGCALFTPRGAEGVAKLIPGDINGDHLPDFYLETIDNNYFVLENMMDSAIFPVLNRDTYRTHITGIAFMTIGGKLWWDAVQRSIALTTGLSHTWVSPDPKPRYPWIDGHPLHTDCVIDLERTLAELHARSGKFSDFQRWYNTIQKYDFKKADGTVVRERTDFFTAEAVPHLIKLGLIKDLTPELWMRRSTGPVPTFSATINKESWYRGKTNGVASGKGFPEWKRELAYIPFNDLLEPQGNGGLVIRPEIAAQLPPVSIFVVMNKGRVFKALGTEIPDSHVGYLIKDPSTGRVEVHHSTPTTDLGMASVTRESVSSFFTTRYCTIVEDHVTPKDKTAVGLQFYTFLPPKHIGNRFGR